MSQTSELLVVGLGIKFYSHLSIEAKAALELSDKLFYLSNNPVEQEWLSEINPNAESLNTAYFSSNNRLSCYKKIQKKILASLKDYNKVCVAFYGHPSMLVIPGLASIKEAKKLGYRTTILPAISSENCLYADLLINPGAGGACSFDASDFIFNNKNHDPTSHLILWQTGAIGIKSHVRPHHDQAKGLTLLKHKLLQKYPDNHKITVYEAAQLPSYNPRIESIVLENLEKANITSLSTVYVPPLDETP